jgi:hypothetical protein
MTAWKVPLKDGDLETRQNLETTKNLDGLWHQELV